jgi:hypothetical protein
MFIKICHVPEEEACVLLLARQLAAFGPKGLEKYNLHY